MLNRGTDNITISVDHWIYRTDAQCFTGFTARVNEEQEVQSLLLSLVIEVINSVDWVYIQLSQSHLCNNVMH